jgi:pimeloyl-ACP methyl ester carboxylesterase
MIRTHHRLAAWFFAVGSAASLCAAPTIASADQTQPTIRWHACHKFSNESLKWIVGPEELKKFKALWARTDCGRLRVPMDYSKPRGRQISIALTRLNATDPARRIGSLAINPGGPGGSGYLVPHMMLLGGSTTTGAKLNKRYDLIGFDPRGVSYSTKFDCPEPGPPPGPVPSPVTEEFARQDYERMVKTNRDCANRNPSFLGQLTTTNVARDLDGIRRGLHERKLSFYGVSWGTLLGAVYRSLYPAKVHRMWLDSPATPTLRLDAFEAGRSKAMAENFGRFAAWLAKRNAKYGFGATATEVVIALTQMRQDFDARPRTFSDLPDMVVDGWMIAQISSGFSLSWGLAAPLLKAVRDTPSGEKAPPEAQLAWAPPPDDGRVPPADLPQDNPTMNPAVLCNEDEGRRDFESNWAAYQARLSQYPVTGQFSMHIPVCAGWPLRVKPLRLRRSTASLVMSAHRYEFISPYAWAKQMRAAIGGTILTVDDDVHGSAGGRDSDCSAQIAPYFFSGRLRKQRCQGIPIPTESGAPPPGRKAAAASLESPLVPAPASSSPFAPIDWLPVS